jgi:flavoprotein
MSKLPDIFSEEVVKEHGFEFKVIDFVPHKYIEVVIEDDSWTPYCSLVINTLDGHHGVVIVSRSTGNILTLAQSLASPLVDSTVYLTKQGIKAIALFPVGYHV